MYNVLYISWKQASSFKGYNVSDQTIAPPV